MGCANESIIRLATDQEMVREKILQGQEKVNETFILIQRVTVFSII